MPQAAPSATDVEFDQEAWGAYLAQWDGGWDGADETWPGFVESFLYYAPEGAKAAASELIAYAEAQSDKAEALAAYGIGIATHGARADVAEEGEVPLEEDASLVSPDPAEVTAELVNEVAMPVLELFLAQHPEFGEMPADQLIELVTEALVEQLETTANV